MTGDPVYVDCEGSGCSTHAGFCSMCGEFCDSTDAGDARPHLRMDILAMIDRGDFG